MSGICTKYVKDDCTFECSIFMYVYEFSKAYRKDNSRIEFFNGEITIRNKETDSTKKYKLAAPTLISVYLNKDQFKAISMNVKKDSLFDESLFLKGEYE